jgi:hypothetical protein
MKPYHTGARNESHDPKTTHNANVYQEVFHVVFLPLYGGAEHG